LVDAELKDLEASVTSPSGQTEECEISEVSPGEYCIKFVPKELGVHTVSVRHRGFHIPGIYILDSADDVNYVLKIFIYHKW